VFIDDDCELSADALDGVMETFRSEKNVSIVNIPMKPIVPTPTTFRSAVQKFVKRCRGMNRHGVTMPFLYHYAGEGETPGDVAEWVNGGGMAVDVSVFRELGVFFPEAFQRFGGYALGEDLAFSFFVFKKLRRRTMNSLHGYFFHYAAGSARLDIENMTASRWYNFHLLFDTIYDGESNLKKIGVAFAFELFMCGSMLKRLLRLLVQRQFSEVPAWARGIAKARASCRLYRREHDARSLLYDFSNEEGRK
jgi:hypothetical protein